MNLYYELLRYPVFSMKEVKSFYSSERTARAALEKLLRRNMVVKIRNGLYSCISGENGGTVANRFQIATAITLTSYVSHHTAFEYYGVADQVFHDVYVSSETRFHDFFFDGYTYHFVKSQTDDGVVMPEFSGGIKVTDKERTIVDSIKDINKIAGLEEVIECVTSMVNINECRLLKYMEAYNNPFLYQKTGFIMSEYQAEMSVSDSLINECKTRVGGVKRYLTNGIADPAYSSDWRIVYPRNMKSLKNGVAEYA